MKFVVHVDEDTRGGWNGPNMYVTEAPSLRALVQSLFYPDALMDQIEPEPRKESDDPSARRWL